MYTRSAAGAATRAKQNEEDRYTDTDTEEVEEKLENLYYNPRTPGSFGGVDALYRASKKSRKRDDIKHWFESQPAYTLHRSARNRFRRNIILVYSIDEQFQADLADVSMLAKWNDGVHFWLTCIDVLSKYAWVIPLRNKSANTVMQA